MRREKIRKKEGIYFEYAPGDMLWKVKCPSSRETAVTEILLLEVVVFEEEEEELRRERGVLGSGILRGRRRRPTISVAEEHNEKTVRNKKKRMNKATIGLFICIKVIYLKAYSRRERQSKWR